MKARSLIIFDLDNCLAGASAIGAGAARDLFRLADYILSAHNKRYDPLAFRRDFWSKPFDVVMRRHSSPDHETSILWKAAESMRAGPDYRPFEDLRFLRDCHLPMVLVTTGFGLLQRSKIEKIRPFVKMAEAIVDDISIQPPRGKTAIFVDLLTKYDVRPGDAFVIGDSKDSELEAGRKLGCVTIQTLRPGVRKDAGSNYHISSFAELFQIPEFARLNQQAIC